MTTKYRDRKSQIRKVPHLRKVRKSNKLYKSRFVIYVLYLRTPHLCSLSRVHSRTYSNQLRSYTPKIPLPSLQLPSADTNTEPHADNFGVFLCRLFLPVFSISHTRKRGEVLLFGQKGLNWRREPLCIIKELSRSRKIFKYFTLFSILRSGPASC
jgi:hypothetical protein